MICSGEENGEKFITANNDSLFPQNCPFHAIINS